MIESVELFQHEVKNSHYLIFCSILTVVLHNQCKVQITTYALESKGFGAFQNRTNFNPYRWSITDLIWLGCWVVTVLISLFASFGLHLFTGHYFAY